MGFKQSFELFYALWRADVAGKRVPELGGGTRESPWTERFSLYGWYMVRKGPMALNIVIFPKKKQCMLVKHLALFPCPLSNEWYPTLCPLRVLVLTTLPIVHERFPLQVECDEHSLQVVFNTGPTLLGPCLLPNVKLFIEIEIINNIVSVLQMVWSIQSCPAQMWEIKKPPLKSVGKSLPRSY